MGSADIIGHGPTGPVHDHDTSGINGTRPSELESMIIVPTDAAPGNDALGCSGCQDLGYCRRGLDQEGLTPACSGAGL